MAGGIKFLRAKALLRKKSRKKHQVVKVSTNKDPDIAEDTYAAESSNSSQEKHVIRECTSPDSVAIFPSQQVIGNGHESVTNGKEGPAIAMGIDMEGHTDNIEPCKAVKEESQGVRAREPESGAQEEETAWSFEGDPIMETPMDVIIAPLCQQEELQVARETPAPSPTSILREKNEEAEAMRALTGHPTTIKKTVSFSDKDGGPLHETRVIEPPQVRRLVLLLLSPQDRKFEFLHLEYPLDDNTTVQVVVDQIPKLASNPLFRRFTFSCLAKTSKNEQLDNDALMGDCELREHELLLGVPMGYPVHQIGAFAVPLLLNGDIIKAVKLAKRSGKGLKNVKSGKEWKRRGKPRKIPTSSTRVRLSSDLVEKFDSPTDSCGVDPLMDTRPSEIVTLNVALSTDNGDDDENSLMATSTETRATPPGSLVEEAGPSPGKFIRSNILYDSFGDCKAELSRLAALEPPPGPDVRRMSRPISHEDLASLDENARSVVDQLVLRTFSLEDDAEDGSLSSNHEMGLPFEDCNESFESLPEIGDDENRETQVPDLLQNILGGGVDKTVFLIHAVSIAAVGYFANLMN